MRERRKLLLLLGMIKGGASYIWKTITGSPPLEFTDAKGGLISKLIQKGKVSVSGGEITCNNGVVRKSKNLLDISKAQKGTGSNYHRAAGNKLLVGETSAVTISGENPVVITNTTNWRGAVFYSDPVEIGETYCLSYKIAGESNANVKRTIYEVDDDNNILVNIFHDASVTGDSEIVRSRVLTPTVDGSRIAFAVESATAQTITITGLMFELGSSPTTYEPYNSVVVSGEPEEISVSPSGDTAEAESLLAVGDIYDEQDIISGKVTKRTDAIIYDGTQDVGNDYIGELTEGNVVVHALFDKYEGDIVTFEASDTVPMRDVKVHLEPIQDLHGYDSPWPAGGGKNLFDKDAVEVGKWLNVNTGAIESTSTNYALSDYIPVKAGLSYIFTNPQSSRRWFYDTEKNPVEIVSANPYTPPSDGFVLLTISVASVSLDTMQFEQGTTLGTYSPYSNICPISGRESVEVEATGKNLCDADKIFVGKFVRAGNVSDSLPLGSETDSPSWSCSDYIKVAPSTQYTTVVPMYTSASAAGLVYFDKDKNALSGVPTTYQRDAVYTFTTPADCSYVRFSWNNANGNDAQLAAGSESSYAPYQGNTHTIPLPETVYGGDIGVVSGDGESKMAMVDLGTLNWATAASGRHKGSLPSGINVVSNAETMGGVCSQYTVRNANGVANNDASIGMLNTNAIQVNDSRYNGGSAEDFKAAMSGVMLCYELATPTPISTTPTKISTVEGQNNVFSPDGDVTVILPKEVEYYVDPQPLSLAKGDNELSVTAEVDDIPFEATYQAKNNE